MISIFAIINKVNALLCQFGTKNEENDNFVRQFFPSSMVIILVSGNPDFYCFSLSRGITSTLLSTAGVPAIYFINVFIIYIFIISTSRLDRRTPEN